MTDPVRIKTAAGECGKCHTEVYHDGMTWRHAENNRNLMHCPPKSSDPTDIVARANSALEGTTPGPWETHVHAMPGATVDEWFVREIVQPNDEFHPLNVLKVRGARHAGKQCCWPPTDADAEFIAASRTLIPELITEVERLRELAKVRTDINEGNQP